MLKLASYNFTIYYYKGSLNLANSSSCWLDYLTKQEAIKKTTIGKLIPSLANKLAIVAIVRVGE